MTAAYQGIGSGGVSLSTPHYVITDKKIGQMFELVLEKEYTVQFGKSYWYNRRSSWHPRVYADIYHSGAGGFT
jgi:hypothetical protein